MQLEELESKQPVRPKGYFLIIDGEARKCEFVTRGYGWSNLKRSTRRFLCVSSREYDLDQKDQDSETVKIRVFRQWSWTLDEYLAATKNSEFLALISPYLDAPSEKSGCTSDKIQAKYYYAGGCARYMFRRTTESVKERIDSIISNLKKSGITTFELGNTLVGSFAGNRKEFVSEYAAKEVQMILGSESIGRLSQLLDM